MASLRKGKVGATKHILFTKWDRFSRNTADASQMIGNLRKMGSEPQAIEQPLDLSVPETKMLLAIYLAMPEIENDRRSMNIYAGMRRARKEGRWMATAPLGYKNKSTESGVKYIAPHEPAATIVKWAFKQLADGNLNVAQILRQARKKGLKCSKTSFWATMRNPVYYGKIAISKFKNEEAYLSNGLHEPIATEKRFKQAQDVLEGRRKKAINVVSLDLLPLRGFLICPECTKILTGSPSKGRSKYYHYYHCVSPCRYRINAEKLNNRFVEMLKRLSPAKGMIEIYAKVMDYHYGLSNKDTSGDRKIILSKIDTLNARISKGREMLMNGDLDASDYKIIKLEAEAKVETLENELTKAKKIYTGVTALMKKLSNHLQNVDEYYLDSDIEIKRRIIKSIFPENFVMENEGYRTRRLNEGAAFDPFKWHFRG